MNKNHITDYNLTLFEIEYLDSRYVDSSFNLVEHFTNYTSEKDDVIENFSVHGPEPESEPESESEPETELKYFRLISLLYGFEGLFIKTT